MDEIFKLFGLGNHKMFIINLDNIKPKSYFYIKLIRNGKVVIKKFKT